MRTRAARNSRIPARTAATAPRPLAKPRRGAATPPKPSPKPYKAAPRGQKAASSKASIPLHPHGELWLGRGGRQDLGGIRFTLLERIAETGSLARAATAAGISYRTAWTLLESLNAISHSPLVESASGGRSGGGSRLTAHGEELLRVFRALKAEHARFLAGLAGRIAGFAALAPAARRLTLSTSARNQLHGTVRSVRTGPLHADVVLALGPRSRIRARITRTGLESLGLRRGDPAFALVKANWVSVIPGTRGHAPAGMNALPARVAAYRASGGAAEWSLQLPGGAILVASLPETAGAARVGEGDEVVAVFDPRHVILGVSP